MNQEWFTESRFGLFIHWGLYAIPAKGAWGMYKNDWTYDYYSRFANSFNPNEFDPKHWAKAAFYAGMRYVVFTTKHHDGFAMFDSKYTDFKITNTPYARDITAELVQAFSRQGMKIGFYHSLVDWHHPDYIPDPEHPDWKRGKRDYSKRNLENYQQYLHNSIEQLLSDYGKIDLLFLDYTSKYKTADEWKPAKMLEMIYRLQPDIMVNDRLSFDKKSFLGDYCTPEVCVPNQPPEISGQSYPWESCMTMNGNWGYTDNGNAYRSINAITAALMNCISKGGNLLLNIGPEASGKLPPESVQRLKELTAWFEKNEESVRGAVKAEYKAPDGFFYTRKGNNLYLYLTMDPVGDIILPELKGKVKKISILGSDRQVAIIDDWGYELLAPGELRVRPDICYAGEVLKIELK